MKNIFYILFSFIFIIPNSTLLNQTREFKPKQNYYQIRNWDIDSLGNHRALIKVKNNREAVYLFLPWRRSDKSPSDKGIVITEANSGKEVKNIFIKEINNEYGEIIFEPTFGKGLYYVYYLPYRRDGLLYWGHIKYKESKVNPDPEWLRKNIILDHNNNIKSISKCSKAELIEFQSRSSHDSFYPMEIIATKKETNKLIKQFGQDEYIVFSEDRKYPIMMKNFIPYKWIESPQIDKFNGEAYRNEFYSFQLGIFAFKEKLSNIKIMYSDLIAEKGFVIKSSCFESINFTGKDWEGKQFIKRVEVDSGEVKALWISINIPEDAKPDVYQSVITLIPDNKKEKKIKIRLSIKDSVLSDKGDSEPWRHSRLRWLNSQIAQDDEIVKPFIPLKKNGNEIYCLGRSVTIDDGFIKSIKSYFAPTVTSINEIPKEILTEPISFNIIFKNNFLDWKIKDFEFTKVNDGIIEWKFTKTSEMVNLNCQAKIEFDGRIEYKIELSGPEDINFDNIVLKIPFNKTIAKYAMGMGLKGGFRPNSHSWKWNVNRHQDNIWIGDVNAGLQLQLKGENYERPLVNLHYHHKKIKLPETWDNEGNGGCEFYEDSTSLILKAYTGNYKLKSNKKHIFIFSLLVTPLKLLNTENQWSQRYYHSHPGNPVLKSDSIVKLGANIINIHHATYMNPFINYPFLRVKEMKEYVDEAHKNNALLKIYYTVREMSNHFCELSALRSLGDEIFAYGPGKGDAWLQEHLYDNYIPAWYDYSVKDAAIITSGMSRLHNYYLEGLDWLTKNVGIDGLYLDDVAYDRTIMKRVRKILDRNRPKALIDLHSWNHYNELAGYANNANLYMESLPYIDRIWFGEVFDYEKSTPDYWLVEISGIPFGVMGEMLGDHRGGNVYRGMVYGITNRLPWSGDPRNLWKLWDEFGIQESEMIGYWSEDNPVTTDKLNVLTTSYLNKSKVLVAIASWNDEPQDVKLKINWSKLKINPEKAEIIIPEIESLQIGEKRKINDLFRIEPRKGLLLIIREKN